MADVTPIPISTPAAITIPADKQHDWRTVHHGIVPLYIDVETGEVSRFVQVTNLENFRLHQRCASCKASRIRTWRMSKDTIGVGHHEVEETTAPDTRCIAKG